MKRIVAILISIGACSCSLIQPVQAGEKHFLVELDTTTFPIMEQRIAELESIGLVVRHILPPTRVIAKGPEQIAEVIPVLPGIRGFSYGTKGHGVEYASSTIGGTTLLTQLLQPRLEKARPGFSWADVEGKLQTPESRFADSVGEAAGIMTGAENMHTSEYLIGRVAVAVILMESNATGGSAEDWTPAAEDSVEQKVIEGADWLCDQAEAHEIKLSWVYEFNRAVPTGYEPIQGQSVPYYDPWKLSWEFEWMDDALAYLQVGQDEWDGCYALANRLRATYQADWGYEVFTVMGAKDPDHKFSDGTSDYNARHCKPTLGCFQSPIVVITYKNNSEDAFLDYTFAHETGHVFGASDEYSGSVDCKEHDDCGDIYGYLRVPNQNCQYCNSNSVECFMRDFASYEICPYTFAQLGWRDTDGDGPADPIDPHSPLWESLFPVEPGDLLRIYTTSGEFVEGISVTDDNMMRGTSGTGYTIWDGTNHSGYNVVPGIYMVHNSRLGQRPNITPNPADSTYKPSIVNISMDYVNWVLNWRLERSWSYIRCFLYNAAGQLIDRRIWDKLHDVNRNYSTSLAGVPRANLAKVKFTAWRPDGAIARTEFTVVPCNCGRIAGSLPNKMWADVSNDVAIGPEEVVRMVSYVYNFQTTAIIAPPGTTYPNAPLPAVPPFTCQYRLGDVNKDGAVNPLDVVRYVNYVYKNQMSQILDNPCGQ